VDKGREISPLKVQEAVVEEEVSELNEK